MKVLKGTNHSSLRGEKGNGMSSMRFIEPPQPNDRVVAVEVNGRLTAEDMVALVQRLQSIVDRGEKALLYVDMEKYEGALPFICSRWIKSRPSSRNFQF